MSGRLPSTKSGKWIDDLAAYYSIFRSREHVANGPCPSRPRAREFLDRWVEALSFTAILDDVIQQSCLAALHHLLKLLGQLDSARLLADHPLLWYSSPFLLDFLLIVLVIQGFLWTASWMMSEGSARRWIWLLFPQTSSPPGQFQGGRDSPSPVGRVPPRTPPPTFTTSA